MFEEAGYEVVSVEWDESFENIDECVDVNTLTAEYLINKYGYFDIIWASFDCTTYSIAAISHHRTQRYYTLAPKSLKAEFADSTNIHVLKLIEELKPKYWFIENPRGGLRKMHFMRNLPRYTVTYCQYGDFRMKPTDIWTNHPDPKFKPMCKNGDPCHESAPRGSRTGTQGLKNVKDRSRIPEELCRHIVEICESEVCSP